jgi:hypothetical protein
MRVFISKYELSTSIIDCKSLTIGTSQYTTSENIRVILAKCTVPSYNICFYTNKCYISCEVMCFGLQNRNVIKICLYTL